MKSLFDTNILIDYLRGEEASKELLQSSINPAISIITKMEILIGTRESELEITKNFLENFEIISLNSEVAEIAVQIRKAFRLKLPDSIIWASSKSIGAILVTRDENFPISAPDIKHPYYV